MMQSSMEPDVGPLENASSLCKTYLRVPCTCGEGTVWGTLRKSGGRLHDAVEFL